MADLAKLDKRVVERMLRANPSTSKDLEKATSGLPDLADQVAAPAKEVLSELASQLEHEQKAREERIERFAEERKAPPPPRPPVQPVNEADL